MARANDRSAMPSWALIAIPAVALLAVISLWVALDNVGEIGPLDRAKLGWFVAVPSTFVLPVVTAWAGSQLGRWGRPVLGALVGFGASLAFAWPIWVFYNGLCAAVGRPVPLVSIATTGALVGLTLFGAVLAAGWALDLARPRRTAAVLAFGAGAVVCAIGFAVFVLLSITLFSGQCAVRPGITP